MKPFGVFVAIMSLVHFGCDTPGVKLVDPEVDPDTTRTITITARLEDEMLAEALGWELGVPGATVSYHRVGDEFVVDTAETDSNGELRLENMLPGQYRFAAYRTLRGDETDAFDGQVRAFGDGLIVSVEPPQEVELSLRADRAGSLVVSEIQYPGRYEGPGSLWPEYDYFEYFELYNNADTTIYLDGMLWGRGFLYNGDGAAASCGESAPYRNDPDGIWAWYIHQFPGSGSDYPLAPGQTAVVALDGVDHSVVHPSLPDLSGADFELEGTADADNPDVPNMPEVGPFHAYWWDHGVRIGCSNGCFLAQATDPELLVRRRLPFFEGAQEWALVPLESIIDVVTTDIWNPSYDATPPCATKVQRSLDRLEKPLYDVHYDVSITMQRRVLRTGPSGFPLLQDVGVSFADFTVQPRTLDWVEY